MTHDQIIGTVSSKLRDRSRRGVGHSAHCARGAAAALVARFAEVPRAALLLSGLAALLLSATACGAGDKTFNADGFGITFTYPSSFKPIKSITFHKSAGARAAARAGVALDGDNAIIVSRYDLRIAITDRNLSRYKREVDAVIARVAGKPVDGRRVVYGGLPGYEYRLSLAQPANGTTRMAVLFNRATEYLINCQSTPDKRSAVAAGCRMALSTLELRR
jgi:hypothetical protein